MSGQGCEEMRLLIQAEADGELGAADLARVARHREACPDCTVLAEQIGSLSARLREAAPYHWAPEALRKAVRAQIRTMAPAPVAPAPAAKRRAWVPFGAGFALAACLALAILPRGGGGGDIVTSHVRALQPGHLLDVASSDQHTVKPWFDGRLDFAPPVKDLGPAGFPLAGGRLDYVGGRNVAALVYYRRQHPIDVFIWPESGESAPVASSRNGYNVLRWTHAGMAFTAVSDLDARELAEFAGMLRREG
ncbi:MAG TPA: anti-sigma factor [Acetobacteraceae bacterium]|nr:anti-sigma factor [Acetobacteraceae bacterium]